MPGLNAKQASAPKPKSRSGLVRAVAKYEAKLAKAPNPTQRRYAASMLRMAEAALADRRARDPAQDPDGGGVVTLHEDEYEVR